MCKVSDKRKIISKLLENEKTSENIAYVCKNNFDEKNLWIYTQLLTWPTTIIITKENLYTLKNWQSAEYGKIFLIASVKNDKNYYYVLSRKKLNKRNSEYIFKFNVKARCVKTIYILRVRTSPKIKNILLIA